MAEKISRIIVEDPHGNTVDREISTSERETVLAEHNADATAHEPIRNALNQAIVQAAQYSASALSNHDLAPNAHSDIRDLVDDAQTEAENKIETIYVGDESVVVEEEGKKVVRFRKDQFGKVDGIKVNNVERPIDEYGKVNIHVPTSVAELSDADDYATKEYVAENTPKTVAELADADDYATKQDVAEGTAFTVSGEVSSNEPGLPPFVQVTKENGNINFDFKNIKGVKGNDGSTVILNQEEGDPEHPTQYTLYSETGGNTDGAMTQKAVTDYCGSAVENINTLFQQENVALSWTDDRGMYVEDDAILIDSNVNYAMTTVNVVGCYKVKFNASKRDRGDKSNYIIWAFVNSDGDIISMSETYNASDTVALTDFDKIVPGGATHLRLSVNSAHKSSIYVKKTSFVPPPNVKATMDYVDDKKVVLDIFGSMENVETITPTWTSSRVIGRDGSIDGEYGIASTNINNSVTTINVEGVTKVAFKASFLNGGNQDYKTLWVLNNADGKNIAKGDVASGKINLKSFNINIPKEATRLIISLKNTDVANNGSVILTRIIFPESITIPEAAIPKGKTYDIENAAVKAFRNIRYNNSDYSYSWVSKLKNIVADYEQPVPITIETPVDAEASSRTLLIADNYGFADAWEIALDLVSTTKVIYNLEPQKWYWWKVIKDDSATDIINKGTFFCEGQIRELRIGASYTEAQVYHSAIQNVRDIGGWPADGGKMRYGVLFRGHELDNGGVDSITAAGKAELLRLGVGVELDLRGASDKTSPIDSSVECVRVNVEQWFHHLSVYQSQQSHIPLFVKSIRAIIKAARANKVVYAHCQGGCDRTGALCWVIEGLCGVSENDLAHDFELSDRPRNDEYMSRQNGDARDSDYKFAMDYVKGLVRYNNHVYTKSRCYDDTFITIGGVDYRRSTYEVVEGVKYFRWYDNANDVVYCTTDVYPTTYSKVYDETYAETSSVITKVTDKFWYDCQSPTNGLSASRITDASLIASLDLAPKPNTLKEKFALLMQIDANNALGDEEIEELRNIFIS